jgi:class 3 adenylate cyclase
MTNLAGEIPASLSAEEWVDQAKMHEQSGELFRAYDIAMQGLAEHPTNLALKYRAVLFLASTGATRQASDKFAVLGLDDSGRTAPTHGLGVDIASLKARLVKDDALAHKGDERRARLRVAAELYEAIFRYETEAGSPEAYYPGINAATLRLLSDDRGAAATLARCVLEQLSSWPAERRRYYEVATEIEALLILGRVEEARSRVSIVRRLNAGAEAASLRARSSTVRQLRLVVEANRLEGAWLSDLAPPPVIHYLGHIISSHGEAGGRFPADQEGRIASEIEARIASAKIGFGYGSLAAGADILFAEALLRHGASLQIVLPFNRKEFIEISVRPAGNQWVERFERCLAAAEKDGTVRYATEDSYLGDDALFAYCSQLAMGLAILRARYLCTETEQIAVWDGKPPTGPIGTAADMANWRRTGRPQSVIRCPEVAAPPAATASSERRTSRRTRAMLFGDIRGFSKLVDAELPLFVDLVLGAFAKVIDGHGIDVLLAQTWGDGLYLVFDNAGKAASCALDLQAAMAGIDLAGAGLPDHLALRLGGHLGPVYTGRDPIMKQPNFFGAHVSRAARIEPVTPEGCVYVTETLAAVLAIHNAEFACDYVGMTEAAKHYGPMRMFLLRRVPAAPNES